jgi:inositol-pentakisphosphate 2-kinase
VPKAGTKAHSYVELQEYWETVVKPLFEPEDLVQQRLVKLGGEEVVSCLNAALALKEETRRADFKGSRVAVAEYGMLVEDMRQSMHRFSSALHRPCNPSLHTYP